MAVSDIFKVKGLKEQITTLESQVISSQLELQKARALLTPEMQDAIKLEAYLEKLKQRIQDCNSEILERSNKITSLDQQEGRLQTELDSLRAQVLVQNELIELETFALYIPRFTFATAELYKNKLLVIRQEQKTAIKNNLAATGNTSWTVNGSVIKGKKMVEEMKKLCLRAFNTECDSVILGSKFNNMTQCRDRIIRCYDAISKLGATMSVQINVPYLNSKLDELALAHEYATQKQIEKEQMQEARAQEREEARARKELEEARKIAVKEQLHYEAALTKLNLQIEQCWDEEQMQNLIAKKDELSNTLGEINTNLSNIDYRIANQRAGYVYIISNIGAFGENIYKIGMTRRLDPNDRVLELGDASVPFRFDTHAMIFSNDAPALEAALHRAFDSKKINMVNTRREFFNVTLDEIKAVVHENHDKTVEFVDYPSAEQFRESAKLRLMQ